MKPNAIVTCLLFATLTVWPFAFSRSCGTLDAIVSITGSFRASSAETLTASRTACSAQSAFRPWS